MNQQNLSNALGAGQCGNGDVTGCDTGLAGRLEGRGKPTVGAEQAADAFRIADGGTSCEGPVVDPDTGQEKHIPRG